MADQVRVFLSSTWHDLQPERAAVEQALRGFDDVSFNGMEYFGSRPEPPREVSLAEVDKSDLYVGIFGRRYGSGITEAEYRRARERGLPCLIYILSDDLLISANGSGESAEQVAQRDTFLAELMSETPAHTVTRFGDPADLATKVATHLHRELKRIRPQTTAPLSPQERENRRRMLTRMGTTVQRQIEDSLQGAAWLALGLQHRPDAVPDRRGQIIREHGRSESTPLSVTDVVNAFDEFDGELLILGAPGAGKSTTLLDLTRVLVERAQADESLPMPIVFHLASWANKRQPLAEWLAGELAGPAYEVPRKLAQTWVESEQILPLLDGLDEVVQEHREACVGAINAYLASRTVQLGRVVVCSREAEYAGLPKLHLGGAILVQPLTDGEVDAYLAAMGKQVAGLRSALQSDADLRELATTPLLLNLMVLTYQGTPAESLPSDGSPEERRSALLTAYVDRMFDRRGARAIYPRGRTVHWLSWLAQSMSRHALTTFHLEAMQSDWLAEEAGQHRVTIAWRLMITLVAGLILGFVSVCVAMLLVGLDWAMVVIALTSGLIATFLGLFTKGSWNVTPVDVLSWSWGRVYGGLPHILKYSLLYNLLYSSITGLVFFLIGGLVLGLIVGSTAALVLASISMLVGVIIYGLEAEETSARSRPNEGIHRSARRALICGSIVAMTIMMTTWGIGALVSGLLGNLGIGLPQERRTALDFTLAGGLSGGWYYGVAIAADNGGIASLNHVLVRLVLWREGAMPLRYVRFLEYATERIFLRRVGGGYQFVHRLVQEHFAQHEAELIERVRAT